MLAHDPAAAVDVLEEALRRSTRQYDLAAAIATTDDAALLSDLAAAYLARAAGADESLDTLAAMNAAERAWQLDRRPETAWNRALALTAMSSCHMAAVAWNDELAAERDAAWAAEARQRLEIVSTRGPADRVTVQAELRRALTSSNDVELLRIVTAGPGHARVMAEEELLPAWATGDAQALNQARRLGDAVAHASEDYIVADSVARLAVLKGENATAARSAIAAFRQGRTAMVAYRYVEAAAQLRHARDTLAALGVPLSARAAVFDATILFYAKEPERSREACRELLQSTDTSRYPTVAGQCAWNDAVIDAGSRRFESARVGFARARSYFESMGDTSTVASLDVRIQENYRWTGDVASAWTHMVSAFRNGAADRGYLTLSEAVKVAEAAGFPFAALAFNDAGIRATQAAAELTDAHLSRSRLLSRLGHRDDARTEVNAAARALAKIGDPTVAARLEGVVLLARSTLTTKTPPADVVAQLDEAVASFTSSRNRRRIAEARCAQAAVYLGAGNPVAAERSLDAALTEIETQRMEIITDEERLALVDTARNATESLVALLYDQDRSIDALNAAERLKARVLLDSMPADAAPVTQTPRILPRPAPREVFVEYFAMPDRVLIWSVSGSGVHSSSVFISRFELERLVHDWLQSLASEDEKQVRAYGERLFRLLLEPVWSEASRGKRLVIAPDHVLYRLPFAALVNPADGRFLIEDREVASAPSLAWLAVRHRDESARHEPPSVLAVVPESTATLSYERLSAAERDVRAIATRFPGFTLLGGAAASPDSFHTAATEADIIHFAGHGVADERHPSRSALLLSNGAFLRAADVARWRLPHARLVVLAACSTGVGRVTADGTAGMARAFLLAGVPSAVATLWPVDDEAAARLSEHFYAALTAGDEPARALRRAQSALLNDSGPSRYDWAAFQLIGP